MNLIEQLKQKYADIRGDHTPAVSLEIKELQRRIIENTEMNKLAESQAGKKLIKTVVDYIEKIDSICMDEQVKNELKLDLLKQRKAWMIVMQTLMGGKSQLDAIKKQINTYLQTED